jgi:hypothetical protein
MNRKISAIVLSLSLVVIVTVAAFAPTLADNNKGQNKDNLNVVTYGQHGEVVLQLPTPSNATPPAAPGTPSHPTCLRLVANEYDKKSTFGAYNTLLVALWIPVANTFVPVAQINDVSNPDLDAYLHALFNNTPVWNSIMPNVIDVNDHDLDVWKEGEVIMVNLTTTVKITLPFNLMIGTPYAVWGNQTFSLPPMTLMFRPTAHGFEWEESTVLVPHPPFSGYTIKLNSLMSPAWVKVDIPTWIKGSWLECSGHICTHIVQIGIPPAA